MIIGELQLPGPQIAGNLMSVENQGAAADFKALVILLPLQGSAGACSKSSALQSTENVHSNGADDVFNHFTYLQALSSSCTAASIHLRYSTQD